MGAPSNKPASGTPPMSTGKPAPSGQASSKQPSQKPIPARSTPTAAPTKSRAPEPEEDFEEEEEQAAPVPAPRSRAERAEARAEARRSRVGPRRRRQHGMAYRWFAAWLPIFLIFVVPLTAFWFYVSFIQPPALKDQWAKIETKWAPARAEAWTKLDKAVKTAPFDLAAYQAAATDYQTQMNGWLNEILPSGRQASYWGPAANDVTQLKTDIDSANERLNKIKAAKTIFDILPSEGPLTGYIDGINIDVYNIRNDLLLSQPGSTPSPFPFPSISPSPSPQPSGSPGTSGSPLPSGSPAFTPAPVPSPTAS